MVRVVFVGLVALTGLAFASANGWAAPGARSFTQPVPHGVSGKWKLVFDDEFSGNHLNTSKWYATCPWAPRSGLCANDDGSVSCEDPHNVSVSGGHLVLTARRQRTRCAGLGKAAYTGAWIDTYHKGSPTRFTFSQGFIETRILEPSSAAGLGFWTGLWSTPVRGSLPGREFDLDEWESSWPYRMSLYYHWPCTRHPVCQAQRDFKLPTSYSAGWHVFGARLARGKLDWYIDGRWAGTVASPKVATVPMDLKISFEVNGRWLNRANRLTKFPQQMLVDYVRVWRRR